MSIRHRIAILLVFATALAAPLTRGQALPEYKVKAAFLFNFVKFVKWPDSAFPNPSDPFTIAILGTDPFGDKLEDTFRNKKFEGREFKIIRETDPARVLHAHLVFIAQSEESKLPVILDALENKPILTVSEIDGFAKGKGMVQLKVVNQQVMFDLNQPQVKAAGLTPSGQMLKIAKTVYR